MTSERPIPVIGILGGVASGKSRIAQLFRERGAVVLDADRAGHQVLREPEVERLARARWGDAIFDEQSGHIDRARLAAIVFAPAPSGPRELTYLEQLTHKRIGAVLQAEIDSLGNRDDVPAIVLDAPVMLKAGWNEFCDHIVFVDAPRDLRAGRAAGRGWSEAEFERREAAQESLETKRRLADVVIDNSLSLAATAAQIDQLWPRLIGHSS